MKKVTKIASVLMVVLFVSIAMSFVDQPKERTYTVVIPESKIDYFWAIAHGAGEELRVKDFKEVMSIVEPQILDQSKKYHYQDSVAAVKAKPDSTKIKK